MTQYKPVLVEPTAEMLEAADLFLTNASFINVSPAQCRAILKAGIAAAPEVNPWVGVKERMPAKKEEKQMYVVLANATDITQARRGARTPKAGDMPDEFETETWITHWWDEAILPIPRPK